MQWIARQTLQYVLYITLSTVVLTGLKAANDSASYLILAVVRMNDFFLGSPTTHRKLDCKFVSPRLMRFEA